LPLKQATLPTESCLRPATTRYWNSSGGRPTRLCSSISRSSIRR